MKLKKLTGKWLVSAMLAASMTMGSLPIVQAPVLADVVITEGIELDASDQNLQKTLRDLRADATFDKGTTITFKNLNSGYVRLTDTNGNQLEYDSFTSGAQVTLTLPCRAAISRAWFDYETADLVIYFQEIASATNEVILDGSNINLYDNDN